MGQAQVQVKQFPKFGIVYPDGVSGIKVVRTFTQGPAKFVNADGSVAYTTPPPTIHELYGGGFAYADGSPVNDRKHLELLPPQMREKALMWFDGSRELSAVATEDVPPLDKGKLRPEPVFVLSSDLPVERDKVREDLDIQALGGPPGVEFPKLINSISDSIKSLCETVKEQGKQIAELKKHPKAPRRMALSEAKHGKQSQAMKAKWADPEYKAEMLKKNPALRKKVTDGNDATETS